MVNQETGRRLPVYEGSRKVYPEFNDDQVWKAEGRGCWNTLQWTVSQLQVRRLGTLRYYLASTWVLYREATSNLSGPY